MKFRRFTVVPSIVLCVACAAPAPGIPPAAEAAAGSIRASAIAEHMGFLAGDALEGRGAGTAGYVLAADYVARQFEEIGLEPAGEDGRFFQHVPLLRSDLIAEHTSMTLIREGRRVPLELDTDYIMEADPRRERADLTAGLAFVGFGVTAPELGYDDYDGIDVEGKIVVLFSGAPASFPGDQRAYHSLAAAKYRRAAANGALGVVVIKTPEERARDPWQRLVRYSRMGSMRWLQSNGLPAETPPELFFIANLNDAAMERLFEGAPQSLAKTIEIAGQGSPQQFDLPLRMEARSATSHTRLTSPNVIGLFPGSRRGADEEYVILTAHLDHLGVGEPVDGDGIHNGAYDNASGVAILIEVARGLAGLPQPLRRSVLFAAVTAEEKGLLGSKYFVEQPTVPLDRIVANINLDMVLMSGPLSDVVAFGAEHSSLAAPVERAARAYDLSLAADPIPEEVIFIRSDQFPFVSRGIPAVFMVSWFEAGNPDSLADFRAWMGEFYHSPRDDMQQEMNFEAGATFARVNLLATCLIANAAERPVWNPGDFFGELFGPPSPAN